jgi:endonuclease/exonuclease/phosphatase family metal-dependent hydrolase
MRSFPHDPLVAWRTLAAALALLPIVATPLTAQVPTGSAAHWKLDEGSGTTASDSSGNGHTGVVTGSGWTTAGAINGALTLDGADDHVTVASPSALLQPAGAYAISAFVKYSTTDIKGGEVASMGNSYGLRVRSSGEVNTFFYNGSTWTTFTTTGANTHDGMWHHLVAQYTGSALQVYVDGVLVGQAAASGAIAYNLGTGFHLGRHGQGSPDYYFNGAIDHVRVYGRALSAAEVSALTAESPALSFSEWKLDEMSGTMAADSSGRGNHGTLTGATWTSGIIDGALSFDGVDDHVTVASPATSLKPTDAYAISSWVRYSTTDLSGGEVATMGNSYGVRVRSTGEVTTFFYNGTDWSALTTTGAGINDGDWHHVTGQYTGSALQIYVDGALAGQAAASGSIAYGLGTGFHLGQHGDGSVNYNFNGSIDQVRAYGRALTPAEIAALAEEPGGTPDAVTVKVLTWNIHKCRGTDWPSAAPNCNRVADAIHETGATVALLSAVRDQAGANAIRDRLNTYGSGWNVYFNLASGGGEGQAIVARHPLSATASQSVTTCGGSGPQIIVKATVSIDGHDVNFFAIDQQHQTDEVPSHASVRLCQAQQFTAWANSGTFAHPRIVGGDFNEESGSATTHWESSYRDGWKEAAPPPVDLRRGYEGNDIDNSNFGRTRRSRLDHVMYSIGSTGVSVTEAKVWDMRAEGTTCTQVEPAERLGSCTASCSCQFIDDTGVRPSDHIPLTVTFTLQP